MSWLDNLERDYERYAIPRLTLGLIIPQVIMYVIAYPKPEVLDAIILVPDRVMHGQWWRVLSFVADPPSPLGFWGHPVFVFFYFYFLFLMGTALENHWGEFRFNIYLLTGYVATVAVSFLFPMSPSSNSFLFGSIFLAFAWLYPDFVIYLFFIIPVKIKYVALVTWIGYIFGLLLGSWATKLLILASISNFLLFFHSDILYRMRTGRRHMAFQASQFGGQKREAEPYHRCTVCGITDITHPDMDFRYCPTCKGTLGYCTEHLGNHPHVT